MGSKNVIRRFTKEDWYGFAGAEKFRGGSDPFMYERDMNNGLIELVITADRNGIMVMLTDGEESDTWYKELVDISALRAEGELRQIVARVEKFEYAPDLSYALDHGNEGLSGFEWLG